MTSVGASKDYSAEGENYKMKTKPQSTLTSYTHEDSYFKMGSPHCIQLGARNIEERKNYGGRQRLASPSGNMNILVQESGSDFNLTAPHFMEVK